MDKNKMDKNKIHSKIVDLKSNINNHIDEFERALFSENSEVVLSTATEDLNETLEASNMIDEIDENITTEPEFKSPFEEIVNETEVNSEESASPSLMEDSIKIDSEPVEEMELMDIVQETLSANDHDSMIEDTSEENLSFENDLEEANNEENSFEELISEMEEDTGDEFNPLEEILENIETADDESDVSIGDVHFDSVDCESAASPSLMEDSIKIDSEPVEEMELMDIVQETLSANDHDSMIEDTSEENLSFENDLEEANNEENSFEELISEMEEDANNELNHLENIETADDESDVSIGDVHFDSVDCESAASPSLMEDSIKIDSEPVEEMELMDIVQETLSANDHDSMIEDTSEENLSFENDLEEANNEENSFEELISEMEEDANNELNHLENIETADDESDVSIGDVHFDSVDCESAASPSLMEDSIKIDSEPVEEMELMDIVQETLSANDHDSMIEDTSEENLSFENDLEEANNEENSFEELISEMEEDANNELNHLENIETADDESDVSIGDDNLELDSSGPNLDENVGETENDPFKDLVSEIDEVIEDESLVIESDSALMKDAINIDVQPTDHEEIEDIVDEFVSDDENFIEDVLEETSEIELSDDDLVTEESIIAETEIVGEPVGEVFNSVDETQTDVKQHLSRETSIVSNQNNLHSDLLDHIAPEKTIDSFLRMDSGDYQEIQKTLKRISNMSKYFYSKDK